MYGAGSSIASRLALSLAAGSTVLSLLVASSGSSIFASSRSAGNIGRLYHLLVFGGIAAISTAFTTYLASGAVWSGSALYIRHNDDGGDASPDNDESGSNASDKDSNENADDEEAAALKAKRWIKKSEIWNEDEDDWVERKKKPDKPDEDADGKLFVVKHRVMPKQPLSEGFTIVEFKHSEHIVDTLRTIIKESEDLFESNAKVEVNALFLAKAGIEEALAKMVEERERRQSEGEGADEGGKSSSSEQEDNVEASAGPAVSGKAAEVNEDDAKEKVGKPDDDALSRRSTKDKKAERLETRLSPEPENATIEAADDEEEDTPKKQLNYSALVEKIDHVGVLLDFIREHFASTQAKLDRLLPKGNISFKLLWCIIKPGMIVKYTHTASGEAAAFQVRRCYTRSTMTGEQFYVTGTTLEWTGEKYVRMAASEAIPQFSGLRKLASLDCTPLSESDRVALTERGRMYASYAGPHFMQFTGALITPGPRPGTFMKSRADGRVMIDKAGFRKMNPSADTWEYPDGGDDDEYWSDDTHGYDSGTAKVSQTELTELSEDDHYALTPPTVHGFSFVLKAWGEMLVDSLEAIHFDKHAYDHLELDEDHKTLIRALVDASREDRKEKLISDVVSGKGGGIIAVLHGNPGVGKTLTAEAVAELLERPLYVQGAGDLGFDAATLENRLRDTLEIARVWKAVVLIDEADIFLEARSHHEISRNALVGVFLRTLEYQQGILFLTTNRVKSFDEAFLSRFSVAIRYPDLDQARRKKVWIKFLQLAGCDVEGVTADSFNLPGISNGEVAANGTATPPKALISKRDLNRFATEPLNGRVVKQTVRTAQALAISAEEPLNAGHIDQIIRINKRFAEDFEAPAPDYQVASESWQSRSGLYR